MQISACLANSIIINWLGVSKTKRGRIIVALGIIGTLLLIIIFWITTIRVLLKRREEE